MDNNLPKPGGFVPPSTPTPGRVKAPQQVVFVGEDNKPHFPYMDGKTFFSLLVGIVTSLVVTGGITYYLLSIRPPEEEEVDPSEIVAIATPSAGLTITNTPIPTTAEEVVITPEPTTIATPSAAPTIIPSNSKIYISSGGGYSLSYPASFTVTENPASAAKGGQNPANTVQIASTSPYFTVNITHKNVGTITSLNDYMKEQDYCAAKYPEKSVAYTVDGQQALQFADIPCGQYGSSAIIVYKAPYVYDIIVTNQVSYSTIKADLESLIATIEFN